MIIAFKIGSSLANLLLLAILKYNYTEIELGEFKFGSSTYVIQFSSSEFRIQDKFVVNFLCFEVASSKFENTVFVATFIISKSKAHKKNLVRIQLRKL